jgi:sulfite exporter TauE/SafE/copper chaperone CopZ
MSAKVMKITLYVQNMTCVNCENTIEQSLIGIAGIEHVKASYSKGNVLISYDPSLIQHQQIVEIIESHDYYVQNEEENEKILNSQQVKSSTNLTNILGGIIIIISLYIIAKRLGVMDIIYSFPIAKEGMGYSMLFLIGILTSVHCVAMCGGICLSQCINKEESSNTKQNKFAAIRPSLLYNGGRIISYTVIGGLVGALGSVVSFSGTMKGIVQILAGIFMVIMGINMLNIFPWLRKFNPRMPKIFAKKIYAKKNSNSPLYIGLLNGLMPCGPLQAMQLYALSTGSPVKGAISMFLFSVGTVPLMFAFGALSSFLNKKFTSKMMKVSAALVVLLGVVMFSTGASLSGLNIPSFQAVTGQAQASNVATIKDGVQYVTTELTFGGYEPIVVQSGLPVQWTIKAEQGTINGCNNSIVIPKFNLQQDLAVGETMIEFTPTKSGTVPYSCWMGMIRSKITVVDDLNTVDSDAISSDDSGIADANNLTDDILIDYEIPSEELAIGELGENGIQKVEITLDENGFAPAAIVVQRDLETVWVINGKDVANLNDNIVLFPVYSAQLTLIEGENPITFYPEQDFDFLTSDTNLYGYVKVVDNIKTIDVDAIRKEISEYRPTDFYAGGGGLPSCH